MITAAQAAKQAQGLGKQLQSVIDVGVYLQELGDLEQAIVEAKRAFAVAGPLRIEAEKALASVRNEMDVSSQLLRDARKDIQRAQDEAVLASEQIIKVAQQNAELTVSQAVDNAQKRIDAATFPVQQLEKRRVALGAAIAKLTMEYDALKKGFQELFEKTRVVDAP